MEHSNNNAAKQANISISSLYHFQVDYGKELLDFIIKSHDDVDETMIPKRRFCYLDLSLYFEMLYQYWNNPRNWIIKRLAIEIYLNI